MRSENCANLALAESVGKAGRYVVRPVPQRKQTMARICWPVVCLLSFAAMGVMLAY